jgi:hypothetical protein
MQYYVLASYTWTEQQQKEDLFQGLRGCCGRPASDLVIFGDGVAKCNGAAFAKLIVDQKLGTIIASEIVKNRQHPELSHKGFQAWFWHVDVPALKAWYDAMYKEIAERNKAEEAKKEAARLVQQERLGLVPNQIPPPQNWNYRYGEIKENFVVNK